MEVFHQVLKDVFTTQFTDNWNIQILHIGLQIIIKITYIGQSWKLALFRNLPTNIYQENDLEHSNHFNSKAHNYNFKDYVLFYYSTPQSYYINTYGWIKYSLFLRCVSFIWYYIHQIPTFKPVNTRLSAIYTLEMSSCARSTMFLFRKSNLHVQLLLRGL
jgi:hypothetical protein